MFVRYHMRTYRNDRKFMLSQTAMHFWITCSLGIGRRRPADGSWQDKANRRSRTRRPSAIEKPLSAHWFLKTRRLALKRRLGEGGWHPSNFSNNLNAPRDGARGVRFKDFRILFDLVRVTAISCDRPSRLLRGACPMRIVSSWRKTKATIFMCGLDALVAAGPESIRAAISGPSRS
jgi:hypothetical protein